MCVCGCHLDFGNVDDISGERKKKKKKGFPTPLFLGGVFKGVGKFHVYVSTIQLDD